MRRTVVIFLILLLFLSACSRGGNQSQRAPTSLPSVPATYAGKTNPFGSEASEKGAEIFRTYCASCHGERGLGDGPAAGSLNPKPRNLQELAPQVKDDYLFWRISEGIQGTAMVGWKGALSEEQIWQVIAFLRALK